MALSYTTDRCSEDEANGENEAFLLAKTKLRGLRTQKVLIPI